MVIKQAAATFGVQLRQAMWPKTIWELTNGIKLM